MAALFQNLSVHSLDAMMTATWKKERKMFSYLSFSECSLTFSSIPSYFVSSHFSFFSFYIFDILFAISLLNLFSFPFLAVFIVEFELFFWVAFLFVSCFTICSFDISRLWNALLDGEFLRSDKTTRVGYQPALQPLFSQDNTGRQ